MAVIYFFVTLLGTHSRGVMDTAGNGGVALAQIARHYLGAPGLLILAATVTLACLKTSVGLVSSCAAAFVELFPNSLGYKTYAVVFSLASFLIANFGLGRIISLSLPALMFLYPLTITLILLCLFGHWFDYDRKVFAWVTACTIVPAVFDLLNALPEGAKAFLHAAPLLELAKKLPFFHLGMGWVVPALCGLAIGLGLHYAKKK